MDETKVLYHTDGVLITDGPDAAAKAAEVIGRPIADIEKIMDFSKQILQQGRAEGLTNAGLFTALINTACAMISSAPLDIRNQLVGHATEAFVAVIGGKSDAAPRRQ